MKLKNIIMSIAVMITALFANTVLAAESTAPKSFIVKGSDAYLISGTKYVNNPSPSLYFKKTSDGKIIYCTQIRKSAVTSGTVTYTISDKLNDSYAYVIENGYPNKSITGNNEKDYYITALAIWYLGEPNDKVFDNFDFNAGTFKGSSNDVVKEVAKLIREAKRYTSVTPSIKVDSSDITFTLSNDKKYYVSNSIGAKTEGTVGNYTVSLENAPKGTITVDSNGTTKTTFATNEKFTIKVPVSSISGLTNEFKVTISAEGTINRAYLYKPSNSTYQSVAALYPVKGIISDSKTIKLNLTTEVQISKVDVTNGKELPGATLTVKNEKGGVVETWVSTNEPHIIKGLTPGKYTLTEEIAPEGYVLSTETVEFTVKADGTVTKVKMENKPEEKPEEPSKISISKKDITTGEELPGAHLEVKDSEGNVVEAWVSTDTPHMIEGLKAGKYTLTETIAPEGYELSTETVEFTVKEDGTVDGEVVMYNKPETIIEVPNTSSFKTITSSLIGIIVIGLGSMMIYKNYKKTEE